MATEEEIAAEEDKDPTPRMRRRVAELRSGGKLVARRQSRERASKRERKEGGWNPLGLQENIPPGHEQTEKSKEAAAEAEVTLPLVSLLSREEERGGCLGWGCFREQKSAVVA